MQRNRTGVGTAAVVVLALAAAAGGCAGKKEAVAKRGKVPLDRSVTAGLATAKAPAPVGAAPRPFAAAAAWAAPVATAAPRFQPVDPTDSAGPPVYAFASPATPATPATPARTAAQEIAGGPSGPRAAAGTRYTVQRGDTLFGIARTRYGSGGQWQRIAAANPGLSPETLQAGATIVLP